MVETNKQESIERQKMQEIKTQRDIVDQKREDESNRLEAIENEKLQKQSDLEYCLQKADDDYFAEVKLNGTVKDSGVISAPQRVWDSAATSKKDAIDVCFKRYK